MKVRYPEGEGCDAATRNAYDTRLTLEELKLRAESLNRDIGIMERHRIESWLGSPTTTGET